MLIDVSEVNFHNNTLEQNCFNIVLDKAHRNGHSKAYEYVVNAIKEAEQSNDKRIAIPILDYKLTGIEIKALEAMEYKILRLDDYDTYIIDNIC